MYTSLDCREAVRYYLGKMRENGTFLPVWKEQPFLWLLHYKDTEDKDYEDITKERIKQLPEYVQEAIKGE